MKKLLFLLTASALFSAGLPAEALEPVNEFRVVVIDAKSATVTARDNKTGNTFKFKVNDQQMLKAIKVGDAGQADFKTGKVTVQPKGTPSPIAGVVLKPGGSVGAPGGGTVRQRSAAPAAAGPDLTGVGVPLPNLVPYIGGFSGTCSTSCAQCPPITTGIGVKNLTHVPASANDPIIMIKLEGAHSYTKAVNNITGKGAVSLGRFSYPWLCPPSGTQTHPANHRITVDTSNAVAETNENDNGRDFYMPPDATFTPQ